MCEKCMCWLARSVTARVHIVGLHMALTSGMPRKARPFLKVPFVSFRRVLIWGPVLAFVCAPLARSPASTGSSHFTYFLREVKASLFALVEADAEPVLFLLSQKMTRCCNPSSFLFSPFLYQLISHSPKSDLSVFFEARKLRIPVSVSWHLLQLREDRECVIAGLHQSRKVITRVGPYSMSLTLIVISPNGFLAFEPMRMASVVMTT